MAWGPQCNCSASCTEMFVMETAVSYWDPVSLATFLKEMFSSKNPPLERKLNS